MMRRNTEIIRHSAAGVLAALAAALPSAGCVCNDMITKQEIEMTECLENNPGYYTGTDSERIEKALAFAVKSGKPLNITRRKPDAFADRDFWLIDRAILLPSDMELQIRDCTIKLSDVCRDNFIRSANCGMGIPEIAPLRNIRILGFGRAVLEGASVPRATGDGAKTLGVRSFGSDAGKPGENQKGDWRNIGVLLAEVDNFQIENIEIRDSHCWALSLEYCRKGILRNLSFAATGKKTVNGREEIFLNQDGIDLRRGCKDIRIENITGFSGDDLVALTAIRDDAPKPAGGISTMVSASFPRGAEDDVENIAIKDIRGYCAGGHHIVRFLNASGVRIHHVTLENLDDLSPEGLHDYAALKIGDSNPAWGGVTPLGDTSDIRVRNIRSKAKFAVLIAGSLVDSELSDIVNLNPEGETFRLDSGEKNLRNVLLNGKKY